ncbi:protein YgfX [Shewanella sp. KJ2020]|uniref:protein YgfX n=1 Tax=Shewanella sp. KJ2020 TaxID=2919172 RepID=UPI0020A81045|nr:hypothetical protein [Shewanella sp. KJ2020]
MEERHHSFSVKASFDQRLSLVVFMSICLSSLLAWPQTESFGIFLLKLAIISLIVCFLLYQLWRLKDWQFSFVLNRNGEGRLATGEHFQVLRRTWVTPFVCLMYLDIDAKPRLLPLWADMFTDADYRHLCRLLLNAKTLQAKSRTEI